MFENNVQSFQGERDSFSSHIPLPRSLVISNPNFMPPNNILTEAETAYYSTIVMSQFAHIWFCRTRQKSVFSHGFRNAVCNYGVVIELAILIILIYIPAFQSPFSTMNQEGKFWTPWIGSLICLFLLNEVRKYWTRKHPKGKVAKWLLW